MSHTALAMLYRYWDGKLPVDVVGICKKAGIELVWHQFNDDNTVSETGLLNGKPCIRVNCKLKDEPFTKTRFIIAHCVAHVVLHHKELKELT